MASDEEEACDYFYAEEDAAAGLEEDSSPPAGADYWAITQETVSAAQKQDLSTVMNLLNIKQYQARALLIHHRWRIDGIYDSLDKGRECMLRNAGIVLQENNSMAAAGSTAAWGTVTCKVCFEDFSMGAV
ncbi:unnamed protein product [Miscanthus lutarioriparius]|uniref:Uncharacterized protein n=1 Tax=Miscanthus lutarioriparius TaxID=422564 RepID=A0A811MKB9_9POAL|nr:unnamed protein product [Miscanthus lutarioriparius]